MIMDILVLAVFALSIFLSLRKGFAAALAGFFKGIAAVVLACFFCDDLAAMLLKEAWTQFGEITGNTASVAVIDRIFAKFCVGK